MDLLVRVLALGALLASAASAEPLVVRASGGVSYDSNVFRLPDGLQPRVGDGRDDLIALGQIGARGEANVSLQQFVVDASATRYEFSEHKSLSFTGLAITGTWNWQVGSRFAGSAGYDLQRRQTSFAEFRSNGRNIVTVKQPFVEGRYLPGSTLFAYGGYRRISGDNSSPILDVSDYRSNVASGGVGYALRNGGELRLGARRTDQHFPNNQPVVIGGLPVSLRNDYRLDEIEAQVRYPFSVKTSLTGRLAYTERKVDQASQRDFSGLTGRLALDYRPSALWAYQIVARRELTSNDDIQTNFVTTKGIAWSVEWRPRPYVSVRADADINRRNYEGFAVVAPTAGRRDHNRAGGLTAGYQWRLGNRLDFAVRRETRDSTVASFDYKAVTGTATLTLLFGSPQVSP